MILGDLETGERLLTPTEVAAALGIGHRTLLSYLADRRAQRAPDPDGRVGRVPVWRESTVEGWLSEHPR